MEEPVLSFALLIGRICLSVVFLVSGIHKGLYFQKAVKEFEDAAIPLPQFSVITIVAFHILASGFLILGIFVKATAISLAVFTFFATVRVHNFWAFEEGAERLVQSRFALAHIAVIGGLLILAAVGPGTLILIL